MSYRDLRVVCVAAVGWLLVGCATPASVAGMTIRPWDVGSSTNPDLARSIIVKEVVGGRETNPLLSAQVSDSFFKVALMESLRAVGLLGSDANSRYALASEIVSVDQPVVGFNMTVASTIRYTLTEVRSGAVIFNEAISVEHTAYMGEAISGSDRLRLATEGSARKNIAALITKLNALKVPPAGTEVM